MRRTQPRGLFRPGTASILLRIIFELERVEPVE